MPAICPEGRTRYLVYLGRELYRDHSQENLQDQKGVGTSHMDKTWKSFWVEGIACTKAQRSPWNSRKARIPVCSTRSNCQYNRPHCYLSSTRSDWQPEGQASVRHVYFILVVTCSLRSLVYFAVCLCKADLSLCLHLWCQLWIAHRIGTFEYNLGSFCTLSLYPQFLSQMIATLSIPGSL